MQVSGAGQAALRRGAGRLLRADEVVVVVMEVVVTVGVDSCTPQGQDVSPAGRQAGLGGSQVGAGPPQGGGLAWQRSQNHGVTVEQRGGCCLQDKLGALDALILITLRQEERRNQRLPLITWNHEHVSHPPPTM